MKFVIEQEDPFKVLSSTKSIVENLQHIKIHDTNLDTISNAIEEQLSKGLDPIEKHFGSVDSLTDSVQLIFLEDTVNFCFWMELGKQKWQVEWPKGTISSGGWYSLGRCFQRAIANGFPILDASYLMNLTIEQAQSFFEGVKGTKIPLLEKRLENLQEAGRVLNKKYSGEFINALRKTNFDTVKIVKLLINDFPSFRDISVWNKNKTYFLKRAQICVQDFSYLSKKYKEIGIKNIHILSGFADYKIPQMLRRYGVISYSKKLEEKVDNYVLIPMGSREEIEIRSTAVWCIELIRQRLKKYIAADIDNALWLISQDQSNVKPYHRTYTIFY